MVCKNCGQQIPANAAFCDFCGARLNDTHKKIFCGNCGAEIEEGSEFCGSCGVSINGEAQSDPILLHKQRSGTILIIISILFVVLLAGVTIGYIFYNRQTDDNNESDNINVTDNSSPIEDVTEATDENQGESKNDKEKNLGGYMDIISPTETPKATTMPKTQIADSNEEDISNDKSQQTYYVVNCNEWITLRSAPSKSADSLAHIPLGQAVTYIENAENGFYKVRYDGTIGYALAQYLSTSKQDYSTAKVVNCNEWITLRSEASTSAEDLAHIPLGEYVKFLDYASNGFYYIEYNGIKGYGLQYYLQLQ